MCRHPSYIHDKTIGKTKSTFWLLMSWLHTSLDNRQPLHVLRGTTRLYRWWLFVLFWWCFHVYHVGHQICQYRKSRKGIRHAETIRVDTYILWSKKRSGLKCFVLKFSYTLQCLLWPVASLKRCATNIVPFKTNVYGAVPTVKTSLLQCCAFLLCIWRCKPKCSM